MSDRRPNAERPRGTTPGAAHRIALAGDDSTGSYKAGVTGTGNVVYLDDRRTPAPRELTDDEYFLGAVLAGLQDAHRWATYGLNGSMSVAEAVCEAGAALRRSEQLLMTRQVGA